MPPGTDPPQGDVLEGEVLSADAPASEDQAGSAYGDEEWPETAQPAGDR